MRSPFAFNCVVKTQGLIWFLLLTVKTAKIYMQQIP